MPKISIILPIYNVAQYLRKCLDSVINQTLTDIEIILGTDGPEDCDKICSEYAAKDNRIKIIFAPGSYGKAFNKALEIAKGEYIGIVETDDWCDPTMFEKLYFAAKKNNADISKCGFIFTYDDNRKNEPYSFFKQEHTFNIAEYPKALECAPSVWSAIYRTEFLRQNKITMIEERQPFIDSPFRSETFLKAEKICGLPDTLYFYYQGNPNQTVKHDQGKAEVLKSEEWLYKRIPLSSMPKSVASYFFKASLISLQWDFNRLRNEDERLSFRKAVAPFLSSLPMDNIDKELIGKKAWQFKEYILGNAESWRIEYASWLQWIFYFRNIGNFKVLNIFGFKFKFRRKKEQK